MMKPRRPGSAHRDSTRLLCRSQRRGRIMRTWLVLLMILAGFGGMGGCASAPETPPPSKQDIQNDADRFFQKMDQEEQKSQDPSP